MYQKTFLTPKSSPQLFPWVKASDGKSRFAFCRVMYCRRVFPPDSWSPCFIFCPVFDKMSGLGLSRAVCSPVWKSFYCHLETIAIPWGKLSVEEDFRLPSIFYDFKFLSSFKGVGSDDLGWACECLLMTERRCTRLSAQSEKSLLSTTLILHSRFEWEKQLTITILILYYTNYYNFAFDAVILSWVLVLLRSWMVAEQSRVK